MQETNTENSLGFGQVWGQLLSFFTKVFVWGIFFAALYLLRSFSVLVFLTFVFSYIQARGVSYLNQYVTRRSFAVTIVGVIFLGVLVGLGSFLIPQVVSQAEIFADNFKDYLDRADEEVQGLVLAYPEVLQLMGKEGLEPVAVSSTTEEHKSVYPGLTYLASFFGGGGGEINISEISDVIKNVGRLVIASISSFLLALLFSFLIVLDLPRLSASVRALEKTKVGFIYIEVSESIRSFAKTLGHALEAQLIIAIINTILTAVAIYVFGIGTKLAFLSLIVFLCSFIPVAGVFISSVPICLLVLEEGGFSAVFLMALVIWGIHLIEAYILNPKIFGNRLHINPVLVLMILTIGGKLFGVWGLLLGVPICTYVFVDAIQYKENSTTKPLAV